MTEKTIRKTASSTNAPSLEHCSSLLKAGRLAECERAALALASLMPADARALQVAGVAALMQGKLQQAVDALQSAARLAPEDASVWDNLGVALNRAGHFSAAVDCFQGSVRLKPEVAGVWVNAAANYADMGEYELARNLAARAVKLDPDLPEAHQNLGNALRVLGDDATAIKALLRAIDLDPEAAPAHMGLALLLGKKHLYDLALKHASDALRLEPDQPQTQLAYSRLCGDTRGVVDAWRAIEARTPNNWPVVTSSLFWKLSDDRADPGGLLAEHRSVATRFEKHFAQLKRPLNNTKDVSRAIRLGFLSGDLRRHAFAYHIEPLLRGLAEDNDCGLEVVVYYTNTDSDDMTAAIMQLAPVWVDVPDLSDDELVSRIIDDKIDVLIDCSGHTDHNRLTVLMRKPAPIQMHWVGYMHSLGFDCIDYFIADRVIAPADSEFPKFFEKLIRLPTYTTQIAPLPHDVSGLPAKRNGRVVFGSLNRPDKISESVVALWSRVLLALPNSRMVIGVVSVSDTRDKIANWFEAYGVAPDRLEFRGRMPESGYMKLHDEIDILLDTFPFSGGTTTSNALWAGVPTVTLLGPFPQQRQSAARLYAVGLEGWVAASEQEFVDIAVRKASNLGALSRLRAGLPERLRASRVFAPDVFARSFADGVRAAWVRYCEGLPAVDIDVKVRRRRRS